MYNSYNSYNSKQTARDLLNTLFGGNTQNEASLPLDVPYPASTSSDFTLGTLGSDSSDNHPTPNTTNSTMPNEAYYVITDSKFSKLENIIYNEKSNDAYILPDNDMHIQGHVRNTLNANSSSNNVDVPVVFNIDDAQNIALKIINTSDMNGCNKNGCPVVNGVVICKMDVSGLTHKDVDVNNTNGLITGKPNYESLNNNRDVDVLVYHAADKGQLRGVIKNNAIKNCPIVAIQYYINPNLNSNEIALGIKLLCLTSNNGIIVKLLKLLTLQYKGQMVTLSDLNNALVKGEPPTQQSVGLVEAVASGVSAVVNTAVNVVNNIGDSVSSIVGLDDDQEQKQTGGYNANINYEPLYKEAKKRYQQLKLQKQSGGASINANIDYESLYKQEKARYLQLKLQKQTGGATLTDDKMYEPLYKEAKARYQQLKLQKQTGGATVTDDKMYEPLYKEAKKHYQQLKLQKQSGGATVTDDKMYEPLYKEAKARYQQLKLQKQSGGATVTDDKMYEPLYKEAKARYQQLKLQKQSGGATVTDDKMYEPLYKQEKARYLQLKLQKQSGGATVNANIDYKQLYKQEKARYLQLKQATINKSL